MSEFRETSEGVQIQCDNCECWEFEEDMWQCPLCGDWICLDDDSDLEGWPLCMIHERDIDEYCDEWEVCADCCDDDCSICWCEDCDQMWKDCECDDDDDDEDDD